MGLDINLKYFKVNIDPDSLDINKIEHLEYSPQTDYLFGLYNKNKIMADILISCSNRTNISSGYLYDYEAIPIWRDTIFYKKLFYKILEEEIKPFYKYQDPYDKVINEYEDYNICFASDLLIAIQQGIYLLAQKISDKPISIEEILDKHNKGEFKQEDVYYLDKIYPYYMELKEFLSQYKMTDLIIVGYQLKY